MNLSRRRFLGVASACAAMAGDAAGQGTTEPLLRVENLEKFVDPLPIPALASPLRSSAKEAHFRIPITEFRARCHRDMPATVFWGYGGSCPGPTFDIDRGRAVTVEWVNQLPGIHLFPIDHTLCGAEKDKPAVRTVVHLHGSRSRPEDDGYPEQWIVPGQSETRFYPNQQDGATLFYHDHAMGITRLNAAAGLMGLYLLRDEQERSLGLPGGECEIPLVVFDRSFRPDGRMFYPVSGDPESPWVSEYYGGGILVNGKLFPYLDVQPRRYRFRLLNASNGSFYRVSFGREVTARSPAVAFLLLGGDQGLHREPMAVQEAIVGPAERCDVLLDFAPLAGTKVYLRTGLSGVMELRVGSGSVKETAAVPKTLRKIDPLPVTPTTRVRSLTLGDHQDRLGRSHRMLLNASRWHDPVTENPVLDSVEIWELINLTDDTHPIHLHLVRFQVLDRRAFDLNAFHLTHKVFYDGLPQPPWPWEAGWKDTVRVDPMTVMRIIAKFEGYAGRYVWHCHMLEHEDNEMMRPYEVVAG